MKYPDDFNTPAFPAGKFIAVSRFMATVVMLLFFIIVCLCGIVLWIKTSQTSSPFLVSIRSNGERWATVEHTNHQTEIPAYYVMQEALLDKFVHNWFTISDDILSNQAVWSDGCNRTSPECLSPNAEQAETCIIYCLSSDRVFNSFKKDVLPTYSDLESKKGSTWTVREVHVAPITDISESGGLWRLNVIVRPTNMTIKTLRFVVYAQIERNPSIYKQDVMGYFISDFNSYRVD